jgi:hypothetical protein
MKMEMKFNPYTSTGSTPINKKKIRKTLPNSGKKSYDPM